MTPFALVLLSLAFAPATEVDLNAERASLLATDRGYAARAQSLNLIDALVLPLAPSGIFIAPGAGFARGPDQARAVLSANPLNARSKWTWTAIKVDVSSDGEHGYTFGYTTMTLPNDSVLLGKYTAYWEKQPDSQWKIVAYRRSPRPAGDVPLSPPAGFTTPANPHDDARWSSNPVEELEKLKAQDRVFSALTQRVSIGEAFAQYAAPDAAQTGGAANAPWQFGPQAIRAAHEAEPAASFSWTPELGEVARSGDLAYMVGFVYVDGAVVGKYLTVWRRQAGGTWRFVVD